MSTQDDDPMSGEKIKATREDLGMTRKDLSDLAKVSYAYLSDIENGNRQPSPRILAKIRMAIELKQRELKGGMMLQRPDQIPGFVTLDVGAGAPRTSAPVPEPDARLLSALPSLSDSRQDEDAVVARVTDLIREQIETWLDRELEGAVRREVRAQRDNL